MFQYSEAIFVSPVVDHFAKEKHGDVLLPRRLRVIEAVALKTQMSLMRTRDNRRKNWRTLELHAAGIECVRQVLLPVLWPVILSAIPYFTKVVGFNDRTSTASPTTDSRSWTIKWRCG